ncbi:MAG: hypothetical protein AAF772_08030 [Acidobacteriota bacterium]
MADSSLTGCLKYGCFGCLTLIVLFVGFGLVVSAVRVTVDEEAAPEQANFRQNLPDDPALVIPGSADLPSDPDAPAVPDIMPLPAVPDVPPDAAVGDVVINLEAGSFIIQPGPPGSDIEVEADYDTSRLALRETYTEQNDGSWRYEVTLRPKGGFLGMLFKGGSGNRNRATITIPRGRPIRLSGEIALGESETDLGGLWLTSVDVRYGAGEHFLEFREPTPYPMKEFRVNSGTGETELRNLGNGSPSTISVSHRIGEFLVDLDGAWRNDASVEMEIGIGEANVWLPETAHVDVTGTDIMIGERRVDRSDGPDLPDDAPRLTLKARGRIGEVRIER